MFEGLICDSPPQADKIGNNTITEQHAGWCTPRRGDMLPQKLTALAEQGLSTCKIASEETSLLSLKGSSYDSAATYPFSVPPQLVAVMDRKG